ncbi:hypothetical protein PanWU01x14_288480, partial [Parasponia andersonii]
LCRIRFCKFFCLDEFDSTDVLGCHKTGTFCILCLLYCSLICIIRVLLMLSRIRFCKLFCLDEFDSTSVFSCRKIGCFCILCLLYCSLSYNQPHSSSMTILMFPG